MSDVMAQRLSMKVEIDLSEDLTWAELFRFIDLVRHSSTFDPNAPVTYVVDDNNSDRVIWGLYAGLDPSNDVLIPRQT